MMLKPVSTKQFKKDIKKAKKQGKDCSKLKEALIGFQTAT